MAQLVVTTSENSGQRDLVGNTSSSYATAHDSAGDYVLTVVTHIIVGQLVIPGNPDYQLRRQGWIFDTSALPSNALVSSALISFKVSRVPIGTAFDITLVSGADIADGGLVAADFGDLLDDTVSRGSKSTSGLLDETWYDIDLNATGIGEISTDGMTKFGVRSSRDIGSDTPAASEAAYFHAYGGNDVKLTVNYGVLTVTTQAVSSIAATTATGNGNITALGSPNPTAHGVCYNTTGSPTTADDTTDEGGAAATGAFTSSMTGLSQNTKYYVKAYATDGAGTVYGSEVNFTTLGVPTVTTQTCESVVGATATGRGNITVIGNPTPTAHGHCWNTTVDPVTTDNVVDNGAASAIGEFTSSITGLTPGTGYYTRAYATNTGGTSYGDNVYFVASTARAGYTWDESSNLRSFDENALERQYIHTDDVDDTPANGATTDPISSNWAYDHVAAADPHTGYVLESLFDAQTILQATSDNTPAALTLTEQTLAGRLTGGNISAVAIGISDNNIAQIDGTSNAPANLDYAKFTTSGLEGRSYQELVNDISGVIKATDVEVSELSAATYDDVQDYINFQGNRTLMSGGAISARVDSITVVTTGGAGSASFGISGDLTAVYKENDIITVNGSSANDGNYTCKADSTHSAGTTTITVDEAVSDGTVDGSIYGAANIALFKAWCKEADSDTDVGKFFDCSACQAPVLTNNSVNAIYADYNAGTPTIVVATNYATYGFKQDHILLGAVYRQDNTFHIFQSANLGVGGINRAFMHSVEHHGAHRASGMITTDGGSLALSVSTGVLYAGYTRHATTADGTSWSYWYTSDSGSTWTEDTSISALTQEYNDITSGKVALGTGKYGVHWVYMDIDGTHLHVVYGQGNYNVTQAEEAGVPSILPPIVTGYCVLIAKIINQKTSNDMVITYPWTTVFVSSLATDHNSLANLTTGDVHTQYFLLAGETTNAQLHSGADLIVYSDAGSTEKARIDGATGNITTAGTVDGIDIAGLDTAVVKKALFDANTILAATSDDTPAALTIDASRIVGRKASGNIAAMTGAETIALLSGANLDVGAYDVRGQTVTADGLTSGRVVFAGTNGVLSDDNDFNFATDTLTVTKIGAFEATGAINFGSQAMTNVNIDSGVVGGITLDGAIAGGDQAFTGVGDMTFTNGSILKSGSSASDTLLIAANDTTFITLTTGATDTMALGNHTSGTINGLTLTSSTGTFTLANGKTLTVSNTLTLTATDTATLAIGGGGTLGSAAYTASTDYVAKATFDAHSLLIAISDNTPVKLDVAEQRIIGRITSGNIAALTAAQVLTLIGVTAGADVTGNNAPQAHKGSHENTGGDEISIAGLSGESADLATHKANTTTAHGAVSAATASKHVVRDASARAKFAAPGASGDALIKGTRVTTAELPAMTDEKYWVGTGTNVEERDVPAAGAATKEFFIPVFPYTGGSWTSLGYFGTAKLIGGNDDNQWFNFKVPHDFSSITAMEIIIIPTTTEGTTDIDLGAYYAAEGEAYNTHAETESAATYSLTANEIYALDASAVLTSLAADDYVGLRMQSKSNNDMYVIGARLRYS